VSRTPRRASDPQDADHTDDRTHPPHDVLALAEQVGELASQVGELARQVSPLIAQHAEEQRQAEIDAAVEERLLGMGLVVPPAGDPQTQPSTPPPAPQSAEPRPREGWMWTATDIAGTSGGLRIIGAALSAWALPWVGPGGVELMQSMVEWGTSAEVVEVAREDRRAEPTTDDAAMLIDTAPGHPAPAPEPTP